MVRLHQADELSDDELIDLKGFVNTIITHITNGNKNEERLVNIMGGIVIEKAQQERGFPTPTINGMTGFIFVNEEGRLRSPEA